ncbi:AraC family ligand binding domain-containing protein [Segnochrobactraceae bacterium EtOH-i3]
MSDVASADPVSQSAALTARSVGVREQARFFRVPRAGGLECLSATFRTHAYAPHTHDSFVIGVIEAGCESYRLGGVRQRAAAGQLCFVNPGVVHDGEPEGGFYSYRMSYPAVELMRAVAEDLTEGSRPAGLFFPDAVVDDAETAAVFLAAHRGLERGAGALATDTALWSAYGLALARHGGVSVHGIGRSLAETGPVARARDFLEAHFAEDVDLARLAAVADLPRTRLIRAFRQETGLTPHAFLTDRRVRAAVRQLSAGDAPVDVAMACGFCDQSHLNRAFKARIGVPPGAFRRSPGTGRETDARRS